jgi:hypothetical protein
MGKLVAFLSRGLFNERQACTLPDYHFPQKYPNSRITGLSNSKTQKAHIDSIAAAKGIKNLTVGVLGLLSL